MVKKICDVLTTLILIILAAMAALLLVPRLVGYQTYAVLSGSMEPEISVGSIVYTKEVEPEMLQERDVVTYRLGGSTMVTHRIVEVDTEKQQFITKGDANEVNDGSPVNYDQVVGKAVLDIPYIGYISIYIRTPLGIAAGCAFLFLMIVLNILPELFKKEESSAAEQKDENMQNNQ